MLMVGTGPFGGTFSPPRMREQRFLVGFMKSPDLGPPNAKEEF